MQQRLIAATLECLVERGYAGTSTLEVQQRAGVSRGALLHHFPSRNELIFAALRELMHARAAEVRAQVAAESGGSQRVRRAIELLWSTFNGPLFQASLELWNAARTDPELRAALVHHERELGKAIRPLVRDLFGSEAADHPDFEQVYNLVLQAMRGEATSGILRTPNSKRDQELLDTLERVATTLLLTDCTLDRVTAR